MTTILIVVVLLMLLGGGGFYGYRRRWWRFDVHRKGICCVTHEPVESSYEIRSESKDKWYFCGRRIRSTGCNSAPISVGNSALGYLQGRYVLITPAH